MCVSLNRNGFLKRKYMQFYCVNSKYKILPKFNVIMCICWLYKIYNQALFL